MTTFITPETLAARFADLAEFPVDQVESACEDANGTVMGYALPRASYLANITAPAQAPAVLRSVAASLARRNLYAFDPPEGVQKKADEALRILRDIASGLMQLPASNTPPEPGETDSLIFSGSEVRRMSTKSFGYFNPPEEE